MDFVYSYVRKSSDEVGKQVLSLESQNDIITGLEKKHDLKILQRFSDKKTGKIPRARPQFNELWTKLHRHQQKKETVTLLLWKVNRIGRNSEDLALLSQMMWDGLLKVITEKRTFDRSCAADFSGEITSATKFSHDLSDDVKTGMNKKVQQGWRPGISSLGYLNDRLSFKGEKKIFPDPDRFNLVKEVLFLIIKGMSVLDAHQESIKRGLTIRLRNGGTKPLSIQRFRKMLKEPFYYGYFYWKNAAGVKELFKGSHQPMLTKTEWDLLQDRISGKRNVSRVQTNNLWFMRLIKCKHCGYYVTTENTHRKLKDGSINEHYYLKCKCRHDGIKKLKASEAEAQIQTVIESIRTEPAFIDWLKEAILEVNEFEFSRIKADKATQTKRQQQILTEMKQLVATKDSGMISESDEIYISEVNRLKGELSTVGSEIADIGDVESWMDDVGKLLDFSKACQTVFASKDENVRREVVNIISQSDLVLDGRKILIQPKSVFNYLKQEENRYIQKYSWSDEDSAIDKPLSPLTLQKGNSGAGKFPLVGLINTLKNNMAETKLLFAQLEKLPDFVYA